MKKILLLFTFSMLLFSSACMEPSEDRDKSQSKKFHSDNAELQEAKALSRKIYEGIEKVEKEQLSREEFQEYAIPLQQKLNALVINMEDEDVRELDNYRNQLMEQLEAGMAGQE